METTTNSTAIAFPPGFAPQLSAAEPELVLTDKIGEGGKRECWRHPDNPSLCIKVAKAKPKAHMQSVLESHYAEHLYKCGVISPRLPRVHGWKKTNRGWGLVTDLIHDGSGLPALTLRQALEQHRISMDEARELLDEALTWLVKHGVVWVDASVDNVVLIRASHSRPQLAFIDGLGGKRFNAEYRVRCALRWIEKFTARQKAAKHRSKLLGTLLAGGPDDIKLLAG